MTSYQYGHIEHNGEKVYYAECLIIGMDYSGADLTNHFFSSCDFIDCNFNGVHAKSLRINDCRFRNCTFEGVELDREYTLVMGCDFKDCPGAERLLPPHLKYSGGNRVHSSGKILLGEKK